MPRLLYSLLLCVLQPIIVGRMLWRSLSNSAHRERLAERFGLINNIPTQGIWLHAVSVGETIAAQPLVAALRQQYPTTPLIITNTTLTGSVQAQKSFAGDDNIYCIYVPYDLPGSVKRFLQRLQPKLCIIMETELWPNLIHYCQKKSVPVVVANARLSEKSAKGYAKVSGITRPMLAAVTSIAVQTEVERERFIALGAHDNAVEVCGSIKFDIEIDTTTQQKVGELKQQWQLTQRPVWIAASTHKGEDEVLLAAHQQLLQTVTDALLILVPRHPERFSQVHSLCGECGLTTVRRSNDGVVTEQTQVLLGDTMGELSAFYGLAKVAFIGGSLVPNGGHNMLEAAIWDLPLLIGPSVFNFAEIAQRLEAAKAMMTVTNATEINTALNSLLLDETAASAMGGAAARLLEDNRGALTKVLAVVSRQLR